MAHRTAEPEATAPEQVTPPDIETMRETVNRLLDPDAVPEALPLSREELETLTATVRGHIQLLAPEVEQAARKLKAGSVQRYTVLSSVWEALSRLEAEPSPRYGGPAGYARRLARALNALCDQHENLSHTGGTHGQP